MIRLVLPVLIALAFPAGLRAQSPETPRAVIAAQIEAMRSGDFVTAFDFASTGIRSAFGTPENFGRMVVQGYPMVIDPAEVRYLDLVERAGVRFQRVLILDRSGRSFLLEYTMAGAGAGLRIAGVRILPETGAGV